MRRAGMALPGTAFKRRKEGLPENASIIPLCLELFD